MADINRVLYTAKQAILSNLTAINVTGANIANVNTPGYSRLRPMFEAVGTKDATSNLEQIGVKISDVQRIYDKYLESQIVLQDSAVGSATTRKSLLSQIEGILNENKGGGINDVLSQFWSAWNNLSANPSGKAERDVLISAAKNLTNVFNQSADELSTMQYSTDQTIADTVEKLNGYLSDIAAVNAEVVKTESAGGQATTLRDNRTELLRNISTIIDINYVERSDGSLYIYLASNGKALVEGDNNWELMVQRNSDNSNNLYDIVFTNDRSTALNSYINGGELGGLLNIRDVILPEYIDELNQTASSVINKVNAQHMSGYDQEGNIGGLFFAQTTEAKYMQFDSAILADARKIAASSTVNADGDNATAMAAIKDDKMYASLGAVATGNPGVAIAAGQINNVGQVYKSTISNIEIQRGATAGTWTINNDGGYASLTILSADAGSVTLDLNGNDTADITFNLSGTWDNGDTLSFSLAERDSTTNIDGYFNAFMARMGQDVSSAGQTLTREQAIANQQNDQREQLSGVSLDEEMLNLIKYQMAYNAAGRITKTVSDMMDILINLGR